MATIVDEVENAAATSAGLNGVLTPQLQAELAALAEKVSASVVVVRGSRAGVGSGVVWNDRGLVITNAHVATGPWAEIDLGRGQHLKAQVIGRAPELDLAALQIGEPLPAAGLTPASIGDSRTLRPGELVIAVGNPMGERNAATLGVVGSVGPVHWPGAPRDVIRVAITLRPGNSGGALADAWGRIVGIPHMVVGSGLALAVPSHSVREFLHL